MANKVDEGGGYKPGGPQPIGMNKIDWMQQWEMPAFPAGGNIPQQNIFRPPGQAQAALGMQNMGPGAYGKPQQPSTRPWGWGQPGTAGKPVWNIYGTDPEREYGGISNPDAPWGKPNYNIFGNPPQQRPSMTPQGAGQAGPVGQPGVTGMFPAQGSGVSLDNWYDPTDGTWKSEFDNQTVIPLTEEQLNDPEFMRRWYLSQQTTIGQAEDMPGPKLSADEYSQLYEEWLASFQPEEMTETPDLPGGTSQPQDEPYPVYPYIPSSWSSGGGKGGGYQNFFKALYWRVGE